MSRNLNDTIELGKVAQRRRVTRALVQAARTAAPLWSLREFVAVNPFVGHEGSFEAVAHRMTQVGPARMVMPRRFYAYALAQGEITNGDLVDAAAASTYPPLRGIGPRRIRAWAARQIPADEAGALPTVADVVTLVSGTDWTQLVVDRIAAWAESYYDREEAVWSCPWQDLAPFPAWRREAALDETPAAHGARGLCGLVAALPDEPEDAVAWAVEMLGLNHLDGEALAGYFSRLLFSIRGWAGFARRRGWHDGDPTLQSEVVHLLAIRITWEALLVASLPSGLAERPWARARLALDRMAPLDRELAFDLLLHDAWERSRQRRLASRLRPASPPSPRLRPTVQAAFCIDVRSEPLRRALEQTDPKLETIGVAGFFGVAVELLEPGHDEGPALCPALIQPGHAVASVLEAPGSRSDDALDRRERRRRHGSRSWAAFKRAAASCLGFVEVAGWTSTFSLVRDALSLGSPASHGRTKPSLETGHTAGGRAVGIPEPERGDIALGILRAMSLTDQFARLVLLCGHGSSTVNNPHARGLDCGACGGHSGDANARLAAALLNDAQVRQELALRGVAIPEDTVFVAGLHETVTDRVTLLDPSSIPASHAPDLERLRRNLAHASACVRRAKGLDERSAITLSRDWSEVRPEWGLAGCTSFIIAPRHRTRDVALHGRSFLHSYQWRDDDGFEVLESIMTAPMVVASWINLQYFASTVDNRNLGSGDKTLHDVAARIGVVEGSRGDLRVGLPLQSLHDGRRWVHEPARLSVVIEAPIPAIDAVLRRHPSVRSLADGGWLHLMAMGDEGTVTNRYVPDTGWVRTNHEVDSAPITVAAS